MVGFVEQDLREQLRAPKAVPYARRISRGRFVLEVATAQGVSILQRQRGGDRVFKNLEVLLSLLAAQGVVEFAIVLDDAKVQPAGPLVPWGNHTQQSDLSRASWRHDFDIPF